MAPREGPDPAPESVRRRFARRIAGAYFLFAGAWILLSDLALSRLTHDLPAFAAGSLVKGGVFLVVSTALLYLFISHYLRALPDSTLSAPDAGAQQHARLNPVVVFSGTAVLAILVVIGMFLFESARYEAREGNDLAAMLELKADQIEQWLAQGQTVARSYSRTSALRGDVARFERDHDPNIASSITARIEELKSDLDLGAVLVLDQSAQLLAAAGPEPLRRLSPEFTVQAARAMASGDRVSIFLHRDTGSPDTPVLMDYIVPLPRGPDAPEAIGALVMREDARKRFFSVVQNWPHESPTAESLLVRRDGKDVLFLNDVRFAKDTAFRMRQPLDETELPAAIAVKAGKPQVSEGKDYRGARVVAASRGIAGTDWFLVAKVDRDEILAPVREGTLIWLGSILCMMLLAAIGIGVMWRQQLRLVAANELIEAARRQQAEGKLSDAEERYRALFERSLDCVFLADFEGNFLDANRAALDLLGYRREEVPKISFRTLLDPADLSRALAALQEVIRGGTQRESPEYRMRAKDGHEVIVEVRSSVVYDEGAPSALLGIARDITERKRAEERIRRLNRVYAVLSGINTLIVHVNDREALFNEACRIAVEFGKFEMAWVGLVDPVTLDVTPVAWAGAGAAELTRMKSSGRDDTPSGMGAVGQAIRGRRPVYNNDIAARPFGGPRVQKVLELGFRSQIALPLFEDQAIVATLTMYMKEAGFFDDEEVRLLTELAGDISYALETLAGEQARQHSDAALHESEQRFRAMIEQSISGFYMIQDDRFTYVNSRFADIFGYAAPGEIVGKNPMDLTAPKDRATVTKNIRRRLAGEVKSLSYSFTGLRKDGTELDVGVHGSLATYDGRPAIIGLLQDISERKRAEDEIRRYIARLEQAMQSTINVVATIGELRDPYTHGHERRVGEIAAAIAEEMGMDGDQVEGIRIAGYMHDVGKIGVPAEILAKPARLTKAEFDLVKDHAQQSYEILKTVPFPWPVAEAAWQHHERLDGSGYPRGLKGEEIVLEARVLAVADVVEAMSSHRPYRPGLGIDAALAEIEKNRGRLFDPAVVDACLRLFREKGYALPA